MGLKLTKIRPVWLLALVASATGLLIYALNNFSAPGVVKYIAYSYSAITLTIVCANVPRIWRYVIRRLKGSLLYCEAKNRLFTYAPIRKYLTNTKIQHFVNLSLSVITNFVFNIFRLGDGLMRGAVWEILLAFYYFFLVILKTVLLWNFRYFDREGEQKIYRRSGFLLLGLGLFLVGMIAQMVIQPTGKSYEGNSMIYLVALYSFYLIISAIVGMVKYRKNKSPTLKIIKGINLIAASVSLLMLQTTMLATFGGDTMITSRMNGISGLAVVILILIMSIYIFRKGFKTKHH